MTVLFLFDLRQKLNRITQLRQQVNRVAVLLVLLSMVASVWLDGCEFTGPGSRAVSKRTESRGRCSSAIQMTAVKSG